MYFSGGKVESTSWHKSATFNRRQTVSNLQQLAPMRESKTEPIQRLVKLVEAINNMTKAFASTIATTEVDVPLRSFVEKIHIDARQFEFELRTELRRLAAEPAASTDHPEINLRAGFQLMIDSYKHALATNLTAHTRAMIKRQFEAMQRAYKEFGTICQAA
jgi:hypothetical protein